MPDFDDTSKSPIQGARNTHLPPSGEAVVPYRDQPPKGAPDKLIHPRRPLPLVPDAKPAEEASDSSNSPTGDSK